MKMIQLAMYDTNYPQNASILMKIKNAVVFVTNSMSDQTNIDERLLKMSFLVVLSILKLISRLASSPIMEEGQTLTIFGCS